MASQISAAVLSVKIQVDSADAKQQLLDMSARVTALGNTAIPPQMAESIANVGSVSAATSKSVLALATAQQQLRVDTAAASYQQLVGKLDIAKQRFDELKIRYGDQSTQAKGAALAVDTLTTKIANQNSALTLAKDKLDAIKSGSGDAANAVQLLGSSYGNSSVALAVLNGRLTEQKAAVKETKAALDQLKSGADSATTGTNNLTVSVTALAATEGRIGSWGQIWIGAMRQIGASIVNMLPSIGSIIGASAELQQNLDVLQQSSGATADQMAAISAKATALGADLSLPGASASSAASAMLELSRAGLDVNSTIDASKSVLELATAAQIDHAQAANIVAGAMNTFGIAGKDASIVVSQLAAGANESSASAADLSAGFAQAGFMFRNVGYSTSDLITSLAALTNVGLTGSDSGTALKNALAQMAAPTDRAANLMRDLGINVRDADGHMKPLPELIGHLKERLDVLNPAQRDAALSTIALSDGSKALVPLLALGETGFNDLAGKVNVYAAQTAVAQAQSQGLAGAMEGFKSSLSTLADSAIRPLLPLMESTVRNLSEFAGVLADHAGPAAAAFVRGVKAVYDGSRVAFEWIRDNANTILTTLAIGAGAVVVAFTPMVLGITASMTASALAGVTITGLAGSLGGLALSAAAAVAPFALMAGAIWLAWEAANAYTEFHENIANSTAKMLAGLDFYASATTAIAAYKDIQGGASESTRQAADELQILQTQLDGLIQTHALASKGIGLSAAEEEKFKQKEFELKAAIEDRTRAVITGVAADRAANREIGSNLEGLRGIRDGYTDAATGADMYGKGLLSVSMTAGLTVDELNKINQAIKDITSSGTQSMAQIVTSNASFQTDTETRRAKHLDTIKSLEDAHNAAVGEDAKAAIQEKINAENTAYADQQTNAATQYAALQAQQRASLGVMLQDWIAAQSLISPAFAEKSADLYQLVQQRYGTIASAEQMAFGSSAQILTDYANGVITNMADANAALDASENKYTKLVLAQNELRAESIAKITLQWESGAFGSDPEQAFILYQQALQNVEREVLTTVSLDAAQAEASAANAQAVIDRIPNRLDSAIFLDINSVDDGAAAATSAISNVPKETYLAFKSETVLAEGNINNLTKSVKAVPTSTVTRADFIGQPATKDAYTVGTQIAAGVKKGIDDQSRAAAQAAAGMVTAAINAAKAAAGIRSPSYIMDVDVGQQLAKGAIQGVERQSGAFVDAMAKFTADGMTAAQNIVLDLGRSQGQVIGDMMKANLEKAGAIGAGVAKTQGQVIGDLMKANLQSAGAYGMDAIKTQGQLIGDMMKSNLESAGAIGAGVVDIQGRLVGDMMRDNLESAGAFGRDFAEATASNLSTIFSGITRGISTIGAAIGNLTRGGWSIDLGGSGGAFGGASTSGGAAIGGASTSSNTFSIQADMATSQSRPAASAFAAGDTGDGANKGQRQIVIENHYHITDGMDQRMMEHDIAGGIERLIDHHFGIGR